MPNAFCIRVCEIFITMRGWKFFEEDIGINSCVTMSNENFFLILPINEVCFFGILCSKFVEIVWNCNYLHLF